VAAAAGRILLIDDDPEIREFITTFLDIEGYEVLLADNGETGLVAAEQDAPDLILLDISMPDIEGLEVCKLLGRGPRPRTRPSSSSRPGPMTWSAAGPRRPVRRCSWTSRFTTRIS